MFLNEEISLTRSASREALLEKALRVLNEKERKAIFLRFWNPCSILEISKILKMTWQETDQFIESTLQKLKQEILALENGDLK